MELSGVDTALLAYIAIRFALGLISGMVFATLGLLVTVVAFSAALMHADQVAMQLPFLEGLAPPNLRLPIAALVIFLGVSGLGRLALRVMGIWLKPALGMMSAAANFLGSMIGGVIGLAQGLVTLAFLLLVAGYMDADTLNRFWADSRGLKIMTVVTVKLAGGLPDFENQFSRDVRSISYNFSTKVPVIKSSPKAGKKRLKKDKAGDEGAPVREVNISPESDHFGEGSYHDNLRKILEGIGEDKADDGGVPVRERSRSLESGHADEGGLYETLRKVMERIGEDQAKE